MKYNEDFVNTKNYFSNKRKRELIKCFDTIWKTITGNFEAADDEYFNECNEEITQDQRHIEKLLKNELYHICH